MANKQHKQKKNKSFCVYLSKLEKEKVIEYQKQSEFKTLTKYIFECSINRNYHFFDGDILDEFKQKRDLRITIRLTEAEHSLIKKISDSHVLTESDYVRRRILKHDVITYEEKNEKDDFDLVIEQLKALMKYHAKVTNKKFGKLTLALFKRFSSPDFKRAVNPKDYKDFVKAASELGRDLRDKKDTKQSMKKIVDCVKRSES